MYRLFFGQNKNLKNKYLFYATTLILCDSLSVLEPILLGFIVNNGLEKGNLTFLIGMGCIFMLAVILRTFCSYWLVIQLDYNSNMIGNNLQIRLYKKIHEGNRKFFSKFNAGEIYNITLSDVENIRSWFAYNIKTICFSLIHFLVALLHFLFFSVPITFIFLGYMMILSFFSLYYVKKNQEIYVELRNENAKLSQKIQDFIDGNRVLKSFNAMESEMNKIKNDNVKIQNLNLKLQEKRNRFSVTMQYFTNFMMIIFIFLSAILFFQGKMSLSELIVLNGLLGFLGEPFGILNDSINAFQMAKTSSKRIETMLHSDKIIKNNGLLKKISLLHLIEFNNVSVLLDNKYILKNLNIKIEPNSTVAFFGGTGSGKSTIANLLERFIEPSNGEIMINDHSINEYQLKEYRQKIGYVFQEPFLYSDTIRNNIFYGIEEKDEELNRLTKICSLDFVNSLEKSFDTIIGEKGVGLSGGEKQRISLARALAIDPEILILDDMTSALDIETERNIIEKIYSFKEQMTKIIIAEKIVSVKKADCIYVLKDGKIIESGTHEELLKAKGYYYQIYQIQKEGDINE